MRKQIWRRMISRRSGSEGPRHDPYSYVEFKVTINDAIFTLHMGLAEFLEVESPRGTIRVDNTNEHPNQVETLFEDLSGVDLDQLEPWYDRVHGRPNRCPRCGCRETVCHDGYVGEQIEVCAKCKKIVWCEPVSLAMIE